MAWVQIQKAQQATWDDYERVAATLGDDLGTAGPPPQEWFEIRHMLRG